MIKIPLKQPIEIGSMLWHEVAAWADKNQVSVKYNSETVFFYNRDADHAIAFRLRFGL